MLKVRENECPAIKVIFAIFVYQNSNIIGK